MSDIYSGKFIGKVSTESGSLNIRDEATTNSDVNGTLARNNTYYFGAQYLDGNSSYARAWLLHYPTNTPTADGYVSARYITWLPSYGDGGQGCYRCNVKVAAGEYVNLRQTPSTSADSIYRLHNEDLVLILYRPDVPVNGWTHIATAGGTGWIMTKYLAQRG